MSCFTIEVLYCNRSFQSFAFLFIPEEILQTSPLGSYLFLLVFAPRSLVLTGHSAPQQKKTKSPLLRLLLCPHLSAAFPNSAVYCSFIFLQLSGKSSKLFSFLPALSFLWCPTYFHPLEDSCKRLDLSLPSSLQFLVRKCVYEIIYLLIHWYLYTFHSSVRLILSFCISNSLFLCSSWGVPHFLWEPYQGLLFPVQISWFLLIT